MAARAGVFGRVGGVGRALLALLALVVAFIVVSELLGWRYLAGPAEQQLTKTLHRRVSLTPEGASSAQWRLHLLGGVHLRVPYLEVASPEWSKAPHLVVARNADLKLRYTDLFHAWRGDGVRIEQLIAAQLDVHAERLADGRASWQFGPPKPPDASASEPVRIPVFDRLEVADGTIRYTDQPLRLDLVTRLTLDDGNAHVATSRAGDTAASAAASAAPLSTDEFNAADAGAEPPRGLKSLTTGTYGKAPIRIGLQSSGVLPWVGGAAPPAPVPFSIDAAIGGARATFVGTATDGLKFGQLAGVFTVKGPSLAAAGDAVGVTLPTTGAFSTAGKLSRDGTTWQLAIDDFSVGASELHGAFRYDAAPTPGHGVPLLQGRLAGRKLLLADLAPAVGAQPKLPTAAAAASAAQATGRADGATGQASKPSAASRGGKVLPDRQFDLPSLRRMDANVAIDLDHLDLGTAVLEPLQPFRGHLQLASGVLTLSEVDARTADGELYGLVRLDGNPARAVWTTDLAWSGVRLERWLKIKRSGDAPPYLSGLMNGTAKLHGQGRSTAEILASLKGTIGVQLRDAAVSHLVVEGAGIDVAQALGVFVKGDDALPIQCGVVEVKADQGVLRPEPMLLNTPDSTVLVTGSVSLVSEAIDLKAVTLPKDFSPMAFRSPVHVDGTFGKPSVSLEAKPLVERAGAAALLALVNPLAALIPFIDTGDKDAAVKGAAGCRALAARASRAVPPPPAAAKVSAAAAAINR